MRGFFFIMLAAVFALALLVYWDTIAQIALVFTVTVLMLATAAAVLALVVIGWALIEKVKMARARRVEAEKQAHVEVVTANGETWVRDTDSRATWRNLTGTPALYVNGKQQQPQEWEIDLHRLRLAAQANTRAAAAQVIPGQAQLLPEPAPLDLLTVFTQPLQAYAIIGGQQTGKTFQARHIAAYWVRQGMKPVVIGPKWDKGEWGGCYLIGGNGDFTRVEQGITLVRRLVEQRHAAPIDHKSHPIQPIFFDDWTPIVDAVPNARALVLEATTLYASVNVVLYFILHSDTGNAWGVDRKGSALKDNFVKLLIQPIYDTNGLVIRSQTRGHIRFAGEATDRPTRLFSGPPPFVGKPVVVRLPEPRATSGTGAGSTNPDQQFVELVASGLSRNQASQNAYGKPYAGTRHVAHCKTLLGE